jgi:hypothetical protein
VCAPVDEGPSAGALVFLVAIVGRDANMRALIFSTVDIPRRRPEDDPAIKARQDAAGKTGFVLGCIAAIAALVINLMRTERPYEFLSLLVAALMAALNVPFGIMLALLAEKWTRPRTGNGPKAGKKK